MFFCSKKRDIGITLLELLLVVVIIGILVTLAIARFPGVIKLAKQSEARAILRSVRSAQIRYYLENNKKYHRDDDLSDGSGLDINITISDYYRYSAEGGPIIGGATRLVTDINSLQIDIDGNITKK